MGPQIVTKVLYYTSKDGSENAWDLSTDGSTVAHDFPGASSQTVAWHTVGAQFSELVQ